MIQSNSVSVGKNLFKSPRSWGSNGAEELFSASNMLGRGIRKQLLARNSKLGPKVLSHQLHRTAVLSCFVLHQNHQKGSSKHRLLDFSSRISNLLVLDWSLNICIFHNFPGDTNAAAWDPHSENHFHRIRNSSQDGSVGTYILPPHTTERRKTTNLKTKTTRTARKWNCMEV